LRGGARKKKEVVSLPGGNRPGLGEQTKVACSNWRSVDRKKSVFK